jgi:hypothetical protein
LRKLSALFVHGDWPVMSDNIKTSEARPGAPERSPSDLEREREQTRAELDRTLDEIKRIITDAVRLRWCYLMIALAIAGAIIACRFGASRFAAGWS